MNLAEIVDRHPDGAPALVAGGTTVTYGQLRQRVAIARGALRRHDVKPGDRVALVLGNDPAFVVAWLAVLGLGGVAVPLNPASPDIELEQQRVAVGAELVVRDPALLAEGESFDERVHRADDDAAVLLFTSGTAGAPRAAVLSHRNLLSNLQQVQRHPGRTVRAGDVALGVLPFSHVFGLNVLLNLALHSGSTVVLVDHFEADAALSLCAQHGVTTLAGPPPMFAALAAASGRDASLSSVRIAASGAASLPSEIADAFEARFGIPLHEGYGLTEASPVVTSPLIDQPPRRGSVGVPLPGVQVRLVDAEGEDALVGDPGEVWVRGANVFAGYWNDPGATGRALIDGWLHTGDVAVSGDDGHLTLIDRLKDLVIVSGFNVYPAEVEEALLAHPDIADAAVVGAPDARTGEAVRAFVVAAPGRHLTPSAVTDYARTRLARYKCPTDVSVVDALPRNEAGKVRRRELS